MAYSVETDRKWQKIWEEKKLYKFNRDNIDKKLYCLEMFSYPSGAKLHVGHWYNFGLTDSCARMKRLQGYEIFQPMGFDAFGLPAENYAIKTGIHPKDSTMKNIETMEDQLRRMGAMFDWDYEVKTCEPEYYKWTQWLFLKLYEKGLAYRKNAPVNWCDSCMTVLANEQVIDGRCERCDSEVIRRDLTQWFFKITEYADELLDMLPSLDWPEKTKKIQTNWIGRSRGAKIRFQVADSDLSFDVFTTRADTLCGVTYVVLAPENPLVDKITTEEYRDGVEQYRIITAKITEIDRLSTVKEKTGVFTGAYAVHPLTGEKVPIWIADYVLASYGTGCVMAVPAHDERDYEFATKFGLPIKRVIKGAQGQDDSLPFVEDGTLVNSDKYDELTSEQAREAIVLDLKKESKGEETVNYRLRDWLVSRQRYWGAPIPIIYCDDCGVVPVPEKDLPVELPYNVEFTPDGKSPLSKSEEFMNTTCPKCGKPARRDPDTLDTFVCSSWYYLRYPDNKNDKEPFDKEWINKMLPVDKYVGGAEHAAMHLLYARFITKFLRDIGYLNFDEPFLSLVHQGQILGRDGFKMSKSRGNTISPDDYINEHGSDVFRLYLAFGFAYTEGGPWSDEGIKAIVRFVNRLERLVENLTAMEEKKNNPVKEDAELIYVLHNTIKSVTEDAEVFQFNTSIARIMELLNALYKYEANPEGINYALYKEAIEKMLVLLSPFAPHFTEEMWEKIGHTDSIFNEKWPEYDEKALVKNEIEIAVQINGKVRGRVMVDSSLGKEEMEKALMKDEAVLSLIGDKTPVKVITVPGKLINIVVK
jgi:leucyl-tRNA synthetase